MKHFCIVLAVVVMAVVAGSGCALMKQYTAHTPLEKAKISAYTISTWYQTTHEELEKKYTEGSEETRKLLREKVNPKMNKLRPLIIKYSKLVLAWEETNLQPEKTSELITEIETLVLKIIDTLGELK